jgi:hypothetical protein
VAPPPPPWAIWAPPASHITKPTQATGGATAGGDGLVLASLLLSATFTVVQGRLLRDRDPAAVTAVQFLGAAIAMLPVAMVTGPMPAAPSAPGPVLATAALVAGGTLLPFTLFAYGQSRVSAEAAGAFLNLEPLVGAIAGVVLFGNPVGPGQLAGGTAILAGIGLGSLPLLGSGGRRPATESGPAGDEHQPGKAGPAAPVLRRIRQAAAPIAGHPDGRRRDRTLRPPGTAAPRRHSRQGSKRRRADRYA